VPEHAPEHVPEGFDAKRVYENRFTDAQRGLKARTWALLCEMVFSRWIRPTDAVLDLGAGYCEFINAVQAHRRIAVDVNPDTRAFAAPGVEVHVGSAADLSFLRSGEIDVVFSSNFLEHLPDKNAVTQVITAALRALRPGGRVVLMGPNVRLLPGAYWDFYDHHVALSEHSVTELLRMLGFEVELACARFMPYSVVRFPLPTPSWLVRAYLWLRPLSSALLGKQFLVVARKPGAA
jgi:SAM-dependent methyltransferase